jgi:small subunit ribosomal protein S20
MTTAITVIEPPPLGSETTSVETRTYQRIDFTARTEGVSGGGPTPLVDSSTRMANIKSQIKRNKQNEHRRERNKAVKTALRTSTKKVHSAVADGDADGAVARQRETARALDKAASKGVLKKRTAARKKSRLARQVNATSAA